MKMYLDTISTYLYEEGLAGQNHEMLTFVHQNERCHMLISTLQLILYYYIKLEGVFDCRSKRVFLIKYKFYNFITQYQSNLITIVFYITKFSDFINIVQSEYNCNSFLPW
jgi:hypothetical protein